MSDIQNLVILTREDLTKQGYVEVTKGTFKVDDLVYIEEYRNQTLNKISIEITFAKLSPASYLFNKLCKIVISPNCKVFRKK